MSASIKHVAIALGFGALCGCELIAGIQDLHEGEPDADAAADASDAMYPSVDAYVADARRADSPTTAGDASADGTTEAAPGDAQGDAGRADAKDAAPTDAGPDATVDAAPDAAADAINDTTTIDQVAPIDGGPGVDSGPITTVLIDDMESVGALPGWLDGPGMDGTWYTYDDGTDGGVLTPAPSAGAAAIIAAVSDGTRTTGDHAAHVVGNAGFTDWGGGMGFNMNAPTATKGTFDASGHAGFRFWARALGDAGTTLVLFNVLDQPTALPSSGGTCSVDAGAPFCSDYYGALLMLTTTWQQFTIPYSALKRPSYATNDTRPLDAAHLLGCQFQANQGYAFDLWVDDIDFIDQ